MSNVSIVSLTPKQNSIIYTFKINEKRTAFRNISKNMEKVLVFLYDMCCLLIFLSVNTNYLSDYMLRSSIF